MQPPADAPDAIPAHESPWPRSAAVVGLGVMGTGMAQLLALAGIPCRVADASAERAASGRERAISASTSFVRAGLMPDDAPERISAGVVAAASAAAAVAEADVVFEAVPEDLVLKSRVLADIESGAPDGCLIATNTSAIPIADLSAGLRRPERFLGAHWFNPAQWVPCVEVIPGPQTWPAYVETVSGLLRRLGKRPSVVGDGPGFVANRIQFAMFKEAAAIVAEGIAAADVVDDVVRTSFGFRLPLFGPFAIADMAGLDVYAGAYAALEAGLGRRMAVPEAVAERVAAGHLGTKTGGGFLALSDEEADAMIAWRDESYVALSRLLHELGDWTRRGR